MADVNESVCAERHKLEEERFRRDKHDIEDLRDKTEKHAELMQQVAETNIKMGEILKTHDAKIENHDQRIGILESKPGKRWDVIVNAALQWIVVAVLAAVVIFK